MADEQPVPIYLSPDEDLTSVRERLERTQARRIILVIPPQTQLRSHVGWRLIHARMREMGKDLLVISPDRQVRAVARAAGFRVAETQESTGNRPRVGSSSTRPGSINTRGAARSRIGSSRGGPDSRASQQPGGRRQTPNPSKRPLKPLPPEPEIYEDDDDITLSRPPTQPSSSAEENQPAAPPPTLFKTPEASRRSFGDFHISTTPSVRPSVPGRIEEEDDDDDLARNAYDDDYNTAQRIRELASGGGKSEQDEPASREADSQGAADQRWRNDPFVYMEDNQQHLPLPEQRGSMPGLFDEIGTNVPDISDRSTEIMENEIEDLGDMGAITPPEITSISKQPPREQTGRPRRPSGPTRRHSPRSPRPSSTSFDDDDELAIPDRPTLSGGRPSRGLASSQRPSQNLRPAQTTQRPSQTLKPAQTPQRPSQTLAPAQAAQQRPSQSLRPAQTTQRPSQSLRPAQTQRPSQGLRPGAAAPRGRSGPAAGSRTPLLAPPAAARGRQPQARRGNRTLVVIFTLIVLLLVVAGLLLYFVPTATVTIRLQAQSYSQNVQLVASANPASGTPGEIQAQILEYSTPVNGQSTASGQARVGDTKAQGQVSFTNNGAADVVIPTGTIVQTTSGIAFQTQAEALVGHGGSFPAVPITAQQAGVSGNVGANTITVIPAESLSKIAANNHVSTQSLSLTVTNPQATSQGGARTVPAATQKDIDALKRTLHKQLQQNLTSWLNAQTHKGDFHGTPMPNILASANPLSVEQFSGLPSVGQAEESGTFTGTLTAHIKILIARASAVSAAAHAILKADALQTHPTPMMLAEQLPVTLANPKTSASADGTKLTISGKATGAVIKQINALAISSTLAGKNVDQASNELKTSMARVGIQNVQITVTPSFLSFMPWRADHIQVILQATPPPPANPVPNG